MSSYRDRMSFYRHLMSFYRDLMSSYREPRSDALTSLVEPPARVAWPIVANRYTRRREG
jgi:hypothetical protein